MSANKQNSQRERFAGPLAIAGLIGAGLLLLVVLYPEKTLLKLLENPEVSSPAQQRYLEALVRLRHGDAELVIPLVRSYLAAGCTEKAAAALRYRQGTLFALQQKVLMGLQYELRRQQLEWLIVGEPGWDEASRNYLEQIELLRKAGATARELSRYLADARRLGDAATVQRLEAILGTHADGESAEVAAAVALGKGDYREAAALYFKALKTASRDRRRHLFMAGVGALQSGNLVQEALVAAEQHLTGELRQDRALLKYMTRLSLAANRPDRAQIYIRQALGISDYSAKSGETP